MKYFVLISSLILIVGCGSRDKFIKITTYVCKGDSAHTTVGMISEYLVEPDREWFCKNTRKSILCSDVCPNRRNHIFLTKDNIEFYLPLTKAQTFGKQDTGYVDTSAVRKVTHGDAYRTHCYFAPIFDSNGRVYQYKN